jgi:UMP kinase
MGMLATTMNGLALQDTLENMGIATRIQTAINMEKIGEGYNTKKSNELIAKNVVTIFTCGTGNPFFSTDTAAIMRAIEIKADIILLAKNVDRTLYKRS